MCPFHILQDLSGEMRWHEQDARIRADDHVSGQTDRLTNATWRVQANKRYVADGRRVDTLAKSGKVGDLQNLLGVADASIDHLSHTGTGGDRRGEIRAGKGALVDLAEQVDHGHIISLQGLDDP